MVDDFGFCRYRGGKKKNRRLWYGFSLGAAIRNHYADWLKTQNSTYDGRFSQSCCTLQKENLFKKKKATVQAILFLPVKTFFQNPLRQPRRLRIYPRLARYASRFPARENSLRYISCVISRIITNFYYNFWYRPLQ